jgi:nitroimidazol reductase NimA-like FMN-containing flavoprotein (pyridoxamine 5'-phosphate oxidase superfamily)
MLDETLGFLAAHDMCVLATASHDVPHCSLMAYVLGRDSRSLLMATFPDTLKWRNLTENPAVSVLVDDRCGAADFDRDAITAVTVSGIFEPMARPSDEEAAKALLAERHGALGGILERSDSRIIRIRIHALQVLEGPVRATYLAVPE